MPRRSSFVPALCALLLVTAPVPPAFAQDRGEAAKADSAAGAAASKANDGKGADAKAGDIKTGDIKPGDSRAPGGNAGTTFKSMTGREGGLALLPPDSVTQHTLATAAGPLAYTATAGTFDLYGETGERIAAMFYTAYTAKDATARRPVTFVFNGGPGAASAYLHLGLVGPRILDFGPTGHDGANARLIDNPQSWLTFTDLVIIDPIGTGWSRAAKSDDAKNFYGVAADAKAMAKAIALYVARNDRAASPKYLLGESYGGFRAAKTAEALRQDQGLMVSGIVMLSPLIDGALIFNASRYPLGAALQLSSMAAAELERRNAFTPEALREVERFAMTDYLTTLAGPPLADDAARAFYGRVAAITGLSPEVVARTRGFVRDAYLKDVRERDRDVVSAYDATLAAPDAYPETAEDRSPDPVLSGFTRAYGGAFAAYARGELGFKCDMTYVLLAEDINNQWQWGSHGKGSAQQASAADEIREALSVSPSFRLLIAQGVSDLVTPYAAAKYVIDHLPASLAAGRVALKLYRGGHMVYTSAISRAAFTADARAFYEAGGDGTTTRKN